MTTLNEVSLPGGIFVIFLIFDIICLLIGFGLGRITTEHQSPLSKVITSIKNINKPPATEEDPYFNARIDSPDAVTKIPTVDKG
jgi:hypothetical protein